MIRNKNTPTGLASFPGISISHHYVAEYQGSRAQDDFFKKTFNPQECLAPNISLQ